jgi:four helix bundle protein
VKIEKFEDIIAWQKARVLTKMVYDVTSDGPFARDFGLRDQIRRAAVSIMSNIAEGYERISPAEFHRFLLISRASCAEVRSQLYIAFDVGYLKRTTFDELQTAALEVARLISALSLATERRRDRQRNSE